MPFWGHSEVHVRAILALKTDPELGHRSDVFLVQFWNPKCGPKRPEKLQDLPRRPERPPERGPGRCYVAALALYPKPAKNISFYCVFEPSSCPRATRERPKRRSCGHAAGPETTRRTPRSESDGELRKQTEKEPEKCSEKCPETTPKRGPKRTRKWS